MLHTLLTDRKNQTDASNSTTSRDRDWQNPTINWLGRFSSTRDRACQPSCGNQTALQRMRSHGQKPLQGSVLQRKCACGNTASTAGTCTECRKKQEIALQTKLRISEPGDEYEQEADRIAEQVMQMSDPSLQQQANPEEKEKNLMQRKATPKPTTLNSDLSSSEVPPIVQEVINSPGRSLPPETRTFMESHFKQNFSQIRIHTDARAAESARKVNALAYTVGNNIVFGAERFAPNTRKGQQLLAHELVHTVQQEQDVRRSVIQRYPACSSAQDTIVSDDHTRARTMLSNAIAAVSSYNGSSPTKVFNALSTHFHGATSNAFATWININLRFLKGVTWMARYECYTEGILEGTWACGPGALATTFWCVPFANIRLCPSYFGLSPTERSTTLIHEWIHKYGCNFDLGYESEADYSQNTTVTQLLNADSFSSFIRDVQ